MLDERVGCPYLSPIAPLGADGPKTLTDRTQQTTPVAHVSPCCLTSSKLLAIWPASSSPPSGQHMSSALVMIRTCPLRMRPKLGLPCSRHGAGPAFHTNSSSCSSALSGWAGDGRVRSSAEGEGGLSPRQRLSCLLLSLGAKGGTAGAVVEADTFTVHFWVDGGRNSGGEGCFLEKSTKLWQADNKSRPPHLVCFSRGFTSADSKPAAELVVVSRYNARPPPTRHPA